MVVGWLSVSSHVEVQESRHKLGELYLIHVEVLPRGYVEEWGTRDLRSMEYN